MKIQQVEKERKQLSSQVEEPAKQVWSTNISSTNTLVSILLPDKSDESVQYHRLGFDYKNLL